MSQRVTVNENAIGAAGRSQRDLLNERRLRARIEKIDSAIKSREEKLADLESQQRKFVQRSLDRDEPRNALLEESGLRISSVTAQLKAYREERIAVLGEIEAGLPTQAQLQERAEWRGLLAEVSLERTAKDRQIEALVEDLRAILCERSELTERMQEAANRLDSRLPASDLDRDFQDLLSALPKDIASRSERWQEMFVGGPSEAKSYMVCDQELIIPETLAHCGICNFGDVIQLDDETASELLRTDRKRPKEPFGHELLPPSIMPKEQWQALSAEAEANGSSARVEVMCIRAAFQEQARLASQQQTHAALWGALNSSHPLPQ